MRGERKKREKEKGRKRQRGKERDGTKGGCRESRETKEDGRRVFGRRGLPVAPGPPAGGGQFAAPFFLIRSFLSPAPPQGPPLPLFFFHCAKLRPRESSSFFVRLSSIVSLFPVRSLAFALSRFFSSVLAFLAPRSRRFSFRAVDSFFLLPAKRATRNRATRNDRSWD